MVKDKNLSVRVDADTYERLRNFAAAADLSVGTLIRAAIKEYAPGLITERPKPIKKVARERARAFKTANGGH